MRGAMDRGIHGGPQGAPKDPPCGHGEGWWVGGVTPSCPFDRREFCIEGPTEGPKGPSVGSRGTVVGGGVLPIRPFDRWGAGSRSPRRAQNGSQSVLHDAAEIGGWVRGPSRGAPSIAGAAPLGVAHSSSRIFSKSLHFPEKL